MFVLFQLKLNELQRTVMYDTGLTVLCGMSVTHYSQMEGR
jgi:hypothetical protein